MIRLSLCLLSLLTFAFTKQAYADVGQILTDYFFQNPADLADVQQENMILGNVFVAPFLEFNGKALGGTGQARTRTFDSLPYLLADTRISDKFVLGFNITPCQYGDLQWPESSVVAYDSTITKVYYYRLGFQASYQLTHRFTMGLGGGLEYNYLQELDAVIGNLGNEVNKVSGLNRYMDAGFTYKITPKHSLIGAFFSPVNTFGHGTSRLNGAVSNNFRMNIVDAAVLYTGLEHNFSEQWFLEEKAYWSNWRAQTNTQLFNTTRGDYVYDTAWLDTWSFQVSGQYTSSDRFAWLATVMYETNAAPLRTNAIGYPLAPTLFFSGGVDVAVNKNLHIQLFYGYSIYTPKAQIDNGYSLGSISADTQSGVVQFMYKT